MRKLSTTLLFICALGLMMACRNNQDVQETVEATIVAVSGESVRVGLVELSIDPAAYEGVYLELMGQFQRLPMLFCEDEPYRSPARWAIASDAQMALAGGFNSQLRAVVPEGLNVTVAGRWQQWEGPVGCGEDTSIESIWYLAVERIISPVALARITLTPPFPPDLAPGAQQPTTPTPTSIDVTDTLPTAEIGTPDTAVSPTASPAVSTPTIVLTPPGTPFSTPTLQTVPPTPTVAVGATATVAATSINTTTPSATGSATPTPAVSPTITGTPQATATSPTPTQASPATPTTAGVNVVNKGSISGEELVTDRLGNNEIHTWSFSLSASDAITVSVAASPFIDIVVSIVDELGNSITERNAAPAGFIERIANLSLTGPGNYQIQVRAQGRASGHYSVILLFKESYRFVAQSILAYGASQSGTLAANSDHFWFFQGNSGESITITVIPGDNGDLFLELYGTDASDIAGFIDNGINGEQEQLMNFPLPNTGLYAIRVGEYDFMQSVYQITLTVR